MTDGKSNKKSISDKLRWDKTALQHALRVDDETIKEVFPSLHLNIGKCYEELNDFAHAIYHYELALSFAHLLPDNGYGSMTRTGIMNALARVK